MKITEMKIFNVFMYRTDFVFVKLETDEGICGIGEGTLEYKENALIGALEDIRRVLIGRDPSQIEAITAELYRDSYWRLGPVLQSAVSAVDMALWDIKGKVLGVPVYELLGGRVRERVPMYANGWFSGARTPEEFAAAAEKAKALGVKAFKWDPFGKAYLHLDREEFLKSIAIVEAVRSAVGNDVELLIEAHGRFDIATGIRIANALKPFDPMFLEEPTPPDSYDAIAEVRRKSPVPIAGGERLYGIHQAQAYLDKDCVDFIQPDVSHCGGITALKKISAMADARYVALAPHNPSGPVANAATLMIAGCTPTFRILEIMLTDVSWRKELTDEKVVFSDGQISVPSGAGLGLTLNEEACLAHPYQPINLRHYRGNLTQIRPKDSTIIYFEGFEGKEKELLLL